MPVEFGILVSDPKGQPRRYQRFEIESDNLYVTDDFSKGAIWIGSMPIVFDIRGDRPEEKRKRIEPTNHGGASALHASLQCLVAGDDDWRALLPHIAANIPELASFSGVIVCPYLRLEAACQWAASPLRPATDELSDFRLADPVDAVTGSYLSVSIHHFYGAATTLLWPVTVSWPSGRLDYPTIEFSNGSAATVHTARDECNKSFHVEREHRGNRLLYHRTTRLRYDRGNSMLYRRIEQQLREQFSDRKFAKTYASLTTVYEGDASNTYSIPAKLLLDAAA